jgi:hypothetical protein
MEKGKCMGHGDCSRPSYHFPLCIINFQFPVGAEVRERMDARILSLFMEVYMKKMRGVIMTAARVCAFVAVLGFIGCDFMTETFGLSGGDVPGSGTGGGVGGISMVTVDEAARDLTHRVPQPVSGATPVEGVVSHEYAGTAVWKEWDDVSEGWTEKAPGPFQPEVSYQAEVTLNAAYGYTFNGVGENTFTHAGTNPDSSPNPANPANEGVVTVSFPATSATVRAQPVSDPDLFKKVPAPVKGTTPLQYFSTPQYTGVVDWRATGIDPHVGPFEPGTAYTAVVTLTPTSGYTFNEAGNFIHKGADSNVDQNPATVDNGNGTATVTIVFPATDGVAATLLTKITDVWLSYYVPAPFAGGTPVTSFSAPEYYGKVDWSVNGVAHRGPFQDGAVYTAVVTMQPVRGYTFQGVAANSFGYLKSARVANGVDSNVVTITFSAVGFNKVPFSGDSTPDNNDSVIDLIRAAKTEGETSLLLQLGKIADETVNLTADTDLGTGGLSLTTSTSPVSVTIDGGGRVVDLTGSANGNPLITVNSGVTLTLKNITFKGLKAGDGTDTADNNAPVIQVSGGTLVLGDGAVIKDNVSSGNGGGVQVASGTFRVDGGKISGNKAANGGGVNGTVTLNSGEISGNNAVTGSGGGVNGTVAISGGEISGNTAVNGGGVNGTVAISGGGKISGNNAVTGSGGGVNGTTTMTGGEISGNNAVNGGGVNGRGSISNGKISGNIVTGNGGGVYTTDPPFTVTGGEISGNTAGGEGGGIYGINLNNKSLILSGGKVSNNKAVSGGGVCMVTTATAFQLHLEGVEISGNTASGNGGGVYGYNTNPYQDSSINMKAGSVISGNEAASGGGVFIHIGNRMVTLNMTGGTINGNTATADGGGVYAVTGNPNNPAIFNMSGTALVSSNNAVNGGGVFLTSWSTNYGYFTMTGGTLSGNTATSNGGGVYLGHSRVTFTMNGGSIEGSSAVSGGGVYVAAGTFKKADTDSDGDSGTIYGDDAAATDNTATDGSGHGHAVWVVSGSKKRDSTAGTAVDLDNATDDNWQ